MLALTIEDIQHEFLIRAVLLHGNGPGVPQLHDIMSYYALPPVELYRSRFITLKRDLMTFTEVYGELSNDLKIDAYTEMFNRVFGDLGLSLVITGEGSTEDFAQDFIASLEALYFTQYPEIANDVFWGALLKHYSESEAKRKFDLMQRQSALYRRDGNITVKMFLGDFERLFSDMSWFNSLVGVLGHENRHEQQDTRSNGSLFKNKNYRNGDLIAKAHQIDIYEADAYALSLVESLKQYYSFDQISDYLSKGVSFMSKFNSEALIIIRLLPSELPLRDELEHRILKRSYEYLNQLAVSNLEKGVENDRPVSET